MTLTSHHLIDLVAIFAPVLIDVKTRARDLAVNEDQLDEILVIGDLFTSCIVLFPFSSKLHSVSGVCTSPGRRHAIPTIAILFFEEAMEGAKKSGAKDRLIER